MGYSIEILRALADNLIYVVRDDALGVAFVVDPSEADGVKRYLDKNNLHLSLILNTHHHSDHCAGNAKLQAAFGASVLAPMKEAHKIEGVSRKLDEGDVISFSEWKGKVIATPGHTDGSVAYYFPEMKALFAGDTLFSLGCGRVFEGDPFLLWSSLKKLRDLPDDTMLFAGHEYTERNVKFALLLDPDNAVLQERALQVHELRRRDKSTYPVTLGLEKKTNPFLRADDPSFLRALYKAGFSVEGADPAAVFALLRAAKDRFAG